MLRTRETIPRLRQRRMYHVIREVLAHFIAGDGFRVVHISIQHNHLHMIVEAAHEQALTRGMQRFAIRTARGINRVRRRRGKVYKFRYKASQITTRSYARNAIAYVLNNWRRHHEDYFDMTMQDAILDTYSSAISFTGWAGGRRWRIPDGYDPLPVSPPRTDLMRSAWKWHGLIDPCEQPGPTF